MQMSMSGRMYTCSTKCEISFRSRVQILAISGVDAILCVEFLFSRQSINSNEKRIKKEKKKKKNTCNRNFMPDLTIVGTILEEKRTSRLVSCFGFNGTLRQYFSLIEQCPRKECPNNSRRTYCNHSRPLPCHYPKVRRADIKMYTVQSRTIE